MRVVLYAEGPGEAGLSGRLGPAPGDPIAEEWLGPGHVLVRRSIAERRSIPEGAVRFEAPLALRGRAARGSDLRVCANLRKLLTWASPTRKPDLAVVLVDADGEGNQVHTELTGCVGGEWNSRQLPVTVGVAVQEFEAWLLADQEAVHAAIGRTYDALPDLEAMAPREAKTTLQAWLSAQAFKDRSTRVGARKAVAQQCRLDEVARRCPSFAHFRKALGAP